MRHAPGSSSKHLAAARASHAWSDPRRLPLAGVQNHYLYQPTKLPPERVAEKNARGCLSEMDAIYGPDGCPLRFCHRSEIATP